MDPRTILIISEDADFPRQVTTRWQTERQAPSFATSTPRRALDLRNVDIVLVAPLNRETLRSVLRAVEPEGRPVLVLAESEPSLHSIRSEFPRVLALPGNEGWQDSVVLLGSEILRRLDAVERAQRAEHASNLLRSQATLGQYVIDMRHTMNNALTSVLGNAELLLLEPGAFSAGVRSQIDTIRNMALRMHEILQRFSSLEKELTFAAEHAAKEQRAQAAAVGH